MAFEKKYMYISFKVLKAIKDAANPSIEVPSVTHHRSSCRQAKENETISITADNHKN
ncbi:hypothetical protein [Algoriphagus sp. Y33]|uniref:hypothetical protein n=1 Tax=Algoriphagus sp. Y33 TaxID=2772483 RepID=UPI001786573D|nr:hypothetical protein [Algoriphagus sp. Y33]